MRLTTHRPWSLVFWDEVEPANHRVPVAFASAEIDAWLADPHRRAEVLDLWGQLGENQSRMRAGRDWMEVARLVKPAFLRALDSGQLVMITDEGNEAWRSAPTVEPKEAPPPVLAAEEARPVKTWIEFAVEDMAGQPLAGRKYRATLTDGTVKKGETDSKGIVRFDEIDPGLCEFVLEGLDGDAWETAEGTEWIEFLVTDSEGKPLADIRWEAKLTSGQKKEGVTGKNGLVRFEGLKAGVCEFRLPDFDAEEVLDAAEASDWIELLVNGTDDQPKPGVEWLATFADGSTKSGTTDESGLVRVERLKSGKVDVSFPGAEAELVGSVVKGGAAKPASGTIEIELVDVDGQPVPQVRFVVESPDGTTREGVTDDSGLGKIENVEEGEYAVTFPDVDASAWEAA